MMKWDDFEMCSRQGEIYKYAAENGYDLKWFSSIFLCSNFCNKELDSIFSVYQLAHYKWIIANSFPEFECELKKSECDKPQREAEIVYAEDVGFMYRLLHILTGVSSKELSEIVAFDYIIKKATGFQHYGFERCAYEIIENFSLPVERYDKDAIELTDKEVDKIIKECEMREDIAISEYNAILQYPNTTQRLTNSKIYGILISADFIVTWHGRAENSERRTINDRS